MTISVLTHGLRGRFVTPVSVAYRAGGDIALNQEGKVTLLDYELCREIAKIYHEEMEPLAERGR